MYNIPSYFDCIDMQLINPLFPWKEKCRFLNFLSNKFLVNFYTVKIAEFEIEHKSPPFFTFKRMLSTITSNFFK